MKFFFLLLITLAVANSFPLENRENTAPETEILRPRAQDTGDLRMQPKIPMIETQLNNPAQQKGWDSNVVWSPRSVNMGERNENKRGDLTVAGKYERKNGQSTVGGGIVYKTGKRGWPYNFGVGRLTTVPDRSFFEGKNEPPFPYYYKN